MITNTYLLPTWYLPSTIALFYYLILAHCALLSCRIYPISFYLSRVRVRSLRHRRPQPLEFGAGAVVSSDVEEQETTNSKSKSHDCGLKVNEISTIIITEEKCEKNYQKVDEATTKILVLDSTSSSAPPPEWSEQTENVQLKGKKKIRI